MLLFFLSLIFQIHFAFRLVPSVVIISSLTLAYMFELGHQLYGELHRELALRTLPEDGRVISASPALFYGTGMLSDPPAYPVKDMSTFFHMPSTSTVTHESLGTLEKASQQKKKTAQPFETPRSTRHQTDWQHEEKEESKEGRRASTARAASSATSPYLQLLRHMEEKCDSFRFSASWLTGECKACEPLIAKKPLPGT